ILDTGCWMLDAGYSMLDAGRSGAEMPLQRGDCLPAAGCSSERSGDPASAGIRGSGYPNRYIEI
ncbi:MAG: hypothetical protein JSW26_27575, partial [Desulfobacterales bacterium]